MMLFVLLDDAVAVGLREINKTFVVRILQTPLCLIFDSCSMQMTALASQLAARRETCVPCFWFDVFEALHSACCKVLPS